VTALRTVGTSLVVGGVVVPRALRRAAQMRATLDRELWGWLDPPGWVMEFVGAALIAAADRRARASSPSPSAGESVVPPSSAPPRTQGG